MLWKPGLPGFFFLITTNMINMKNLKIIFLFLLLTGWGITPLNAQTLLKKVTGKWKVIKYQDQLKTMALADTLEFQADGTFLSDSIYFKSGNGLFRTDENNSVVIIETPEATTEWSVSLSKGVLRLRSIPKSKKPKTYITLVKLKA